MLPVYRYGLFESINVVYVEAEWRNFCANRIIIKGRIGTRRDRLKTPDVSLALIQRPRRLKTTSECVHGQLRDASATLYLTNR